MNRLIYSNKVNRDIKYKELKAKGIQSRRYSTGPQQVHPMCIEDQKQGLAESDKGFGNTIYKTYYANLYCLEWGN